MKWLSAFVLLMSVNPAIACTNPAVTVPAGSIEMVYTNVECVATYTPYATITDAVASQFVTWCEASFNIPTPTACFNAWFDYVINDVLGRIQTSQTTIPPKLTITPAQ